LTNLNVVTAISDGSITADKVSSDILTQASLTNGAINALIVGSRLNTVGQFSMAVGARNTVTNCSFAAGLGTKALGSYSSAEGYHSEASGYVSHAEGNYTEAAGNYSHAEGWSTEASGSASHAEGYNTTASGGGAHAQGGNTTASGLYSSVAGYESEANGVISTALGSSAIANHDYSFVWSSSSATNCLVEFESTTNYQFSVYAENGIRLLGGPISGDGSGLTNLNVSGTSITNMVGITALGSGQIITEAERSSIAANESQVATNASIIASIDVIVSGLDSEVVALQSASTNWNEAHGWGDHAEAGYASNSNLLGHTEGVNNPHNVTAAQLGVYTTNETQMAIDTALAEVPVEDFVKTNHVGSVAIDGTLTVETNLYVYGKSVIGQPIFALDVATNEAYSTNSLVVEGDIHTFGKYYGDGSALTGLDVVVSEVDPVFSSSVASGITTNDIAIWNAGGSGSCVTNAMLLDGSVAMQASLDMASNRVTQVAAPVDDGDAVNLASLKSLLQALPAQGDLSMGVYTNGTQPVIQF
jgi:hypothetical protein